MSLPLAAFSDGFFIFGVILVVLLVGAFLASRMVAGRVKGQMQQRPSPDNLRGDADRPLHEREDDAPGSVVDEGADVRMR